MLAALPAAYAQQPQEQAQAVVRRDRPAQAVYSDSIVNRLRVPAGFAINIYASNLGNPRMMEVAGDGTVYVTRRASGDVLALRDNDGDGRADTFEVVARGLPGVNGIALRGDDLYLATSQTIWRKPVPGPAAPQAVVSGLPEGGQHPNRMVRFAPDGAMFVQVGSSCNDCAEENLLERGTLIRYSNDGSRRTIYANGLRNTIGFDWHPVSGALWGMDHGSDLRGDTVPPEELNQIKAGGNYGWPVCYGNRTVDPMTNAGPERLAIEPGQARPKVGNITTRQQYCDLTEPATLLLPAHSAPIALRFYTAQQFPQVWRNDAYVALRGSWNRGDPVGYKVARIRFSATGQPVGVEDFVTGFLSEDASTFFGRPAGIAIGADGALLVSDDTLGVIYRIAWVGLR